MADWETPGETLQRVREERGWSPFEAARRGGFGDQQLKNIESGKTLPGECKTRTLMKILALYWPDVQLSELLDFQPFDLVPHSAAAATLLGSRSTSAEFLKQLRELAKPLTPA